ncbi:MAG: serine hydrolase [Actinomycetota bacterium]|nr:serine hydrolase [Actinomycetota bacterium]
MAGLGEAFERIGTFLEHRLPLTHAAGAALAVTDRDEVLGVVVRGFADAASGAPVRPETRFEIGSISKSFAAVVAIQEATALRLDVHAPITDYLPGLELPQPFGPISTHHLMTHTSGLAVGTEDAPTGVGAVWRLRGVPPTFAPGERFWYSNDGWKLVGILLERLTGTPFHELVRERVLGPLGMTSSEAAITNGTRSDLATGYETMYDDRPPRTDHPLVPARWLVSNTADGSIVSSAIDVSAYAQMLIRRGAGPATRVLSEEGFTLLTTPVALDAGEPGFAYAYGLWVGDVGGRREIWHTGGMVGYTAMLAVRPDDGLGCAMLLNGQGEPRATVRFALDCVAAALRDEALPEVEPPPSATAVPNAADYVGVYRGTGREIEIERAGDGIRLRDGALGVVLERLDGDRFLVPHPARDRFLLSFGRDDSGTVVEAFHGNDWYPAGAVTGPEPAPHPAEWAAFGGVYRANNPWAPVLRVMLRKGALVASWPGESTEEPLIPIGNGSFAVGEPWKPQRLRFEGVVDGRATVAEFNGGRWYRSFEE